MSALQELERRPFLARLRGAARRDGSRGLALGVLRRTTFYRHLLLLEHDLSRPVTPVPCDLPMRVAELREEEAGAYARYRSDQPPDEARRRLAQGGTCFVAWHEGRIVSSTWVHAGEAWSRELDRRFRLAPSELYSRDTHTAPALRGRAVAPAREAVVLSRLGARGYCRAVAFVEPWNDASLRYHEKMGWRRVGHAGFLDLGPLRIDFLKLRGASRTWRVRRRRRMLDVHTQPPAPEPVGLLSRPGVDGRGWSFSRLQSGRRPDS